MTASRSLRTMRNISEVHHMLIYTFVDMSLLENAFHKCIALKKLRL